MRRRTRPRWKRKWKRVKRATRKRVRNPVWALGGTALVAALVWSAVRIHRSRPELLMQRARIALTHTKPELALELMQSVLATRPDHVAAIKIKALAQLQAMLLDEAKVTLDRLIEQRPDLVDGHRLLMRWALLAMDRELKPSGENPPASDGVGFSAPMHEALAQAGWLEVHGNIAGESDLIRARCARLDARRLGLALPLQQDVPSHENVNIDQPQAEEATASFVPPPAEILRRGIQSRQSRVEEMLRSALRLNPRYFDAWTMYVQVLLERNAWDELWDAAGRLGMQTGLPAVVAASTTAALFVIPESVQPRYKKIEAGWQLQSIVTPRERQGLLWQRTSAELHLVAGEPPKALPLLEEALNVRPNDQTTRFLLAKCLYGLRQYARALTVIDKLGAELPAAAAVQSLYGLTLLEVGDVYSAERVLRRALRLDTGDSTARAGLLTLMAQQGRLAEAESDVREHYRRNESDWFAIGLLMQLEQSRGRSEAVRLLLQRVEKRSPLRDEELTVLVDGYAFLGDAEKTERYARNLLQRRPDSLAARLAQAQASLMRGRYGQAKQQLIALHHAFPDSAKVSQHLGSLYLRQQRFDQATAQLLRVVAREPNNTSARLLLVRGLAGLSRMTDALDQLEHVLAQDPDNIVAFKLLLRLVRADAPGNRLTDDLRQLDDAGSFESAGPAQLAQLKLRVGKRDEAAHICRRAIKAGDHDPFLRLVLARIHVDKGEFEQAERQLVALVHNHPGNPLGYQLLARLYLDRDRPREGVTALRRLESLNAPMARLAQSWLLWRTGKIEAAYNLLSGDYASLVSEHHPLALAFADAMASLHLNMRDSVSAEGIYHALVQADHYAGQAALREIDLKEKRQSVPATLRSLDALAGCLQSDDDHLRFEMMQRYARLGRRDRALALLDQWIEQSPDNTHLLRGKASLLIEMSRLSDAARALRRAVSIASDDVTLWRRLGQVLRMNFDFPGAEAVYEHMIGIDDGARVVALADLSRMYLDLGLMDRATRTLRRLGRLDLPVEPEIGLALARVLGDLGEDERAAGYLARVPSTAPEYPAAQVLLARLDQRAGSADKTRSRLNALLRDPRTREGAVAAVLSSRTVDPMRSRMIEWMDARIDPDDLPAALKQRWLRLRVSLASERLDWDSVQSTLRRLARIEGDPTQATVGRVTVLVYQGRLGEGRRIFQESPTLPVSDQGRLLAVAMDLPPHDLAPGAPLAVLIEAILQNDLVSARAVAGAVASQTWMYRGDLVCWLEHMDAQLPRVRAGCRDVALSVLARESGLHRLAAEISLRVVDRLPDWLPAHAIHIQSLLALGLPIDAAVDRVRRFAPESSLAMFVAAQQEIVAHDLFGAAAHAESLLEREPSSTSVRLLLAELYGATGRAEEAISLLEELHNTNPQPAVVLSADPKMTRSHDAGRVVPLSSAIDAGLAHRLTVANNLACLLAQHRPQRLTDAYHIGLEALQASGELFGGGGGAAGLLDTVGWIEHLREDDLLALRHLGQAIATGNCVPAIHRHLASVYQSLGNRTWARYHREAAASPNEEG